MFSIIVPVYNTPIVNFKKCISSLTKEKEIPFEIIVIDDGSGEELSKKYDEVCDIYDNVKYYKKDNGGVSSARNYGINVAREDYLIFVDSDDIVTDNFLFDAKEYLEKNDVELIIGQILFLENEKKQNIEPKQDFKCMLVKEEVIQQVYKSLLNIEQNVIPIKILGSPCGKVYKRSIAKKILFPEGVTHWEDQIFNRMYIKECKSILITPEYWYLYYQNEFSAMHASLKNNYIKKSIPFWKIWQELNSQESENIQKEMMKKNIDFYYSAIHSDLLNMNVCWLKKRRIMDVLWHEKIFVDTIKKLNIGSFDEKKDKIRFFLLEKHAYLLIYLVIKIKTLRGDS